MPDNVTASAVSGSGPIFATDQDSGTLAHYPKGKLVFGANDTFTDVSLANGFPVQPGTGSVWPLSPSTNAGAAVKTADYDTGAGTDTLTVFGIALPASGGAVAGGTAANPIRTDPTGTTAQPVSDGGGSLTVDGAVTAQLTPATSGGLSVYSAASTTAALAASIKATAGQVYGIHVTNTNAAARYLRLYNQTTAPASTDTPVYRVAIPGNTAGAGAVIPIPTGIAFSTGIGVRVTGGAADNDATALAANEVLVNVTYK